MPVPSPASADDSERRFGFAVEELHRVPRPGAADRQFEPLRKRVHHRDADAVQAAGNLVGIAVEFPAGVKPRHDHLGGGHPFLVVDFGRDAASVVGDGDGPVGVERHADAVAESRQRLVDRIVHHLEHHVVEARTVVGIADIHAGALADGVEPAQHLDRLGVVSGRLAHAGPTVAVGRSAPPPAVKNCARPSRAANWRGSAPVSQVWPPSATAASSSAARRSASRCAPTSSRSRSGGPPRRAA